MARGAPGGDAEEGHAEGLHAVARLGDVGLARRRGLLQPTPRQSEVLILIGRRGMTQRRAAAQMGITEATLTEHLQNIKDIYLRTHPGAQADITPTHAARLLAEERGLR